MREAQPGPRVRAGGDRDSPLRLQQHAGPVGPPAQQKLGQQKKFSQPNQEHVFVKCPQECFATWYLY